MTYDTSVRNKSLQTIHTKFFAMNSYRFSNTTKTSSVDYIVTKESINLYTLLLLYPSFKGD